MARRTTIFHKDNMLFCILRRVSFKSIAASKHHCRAVFMGQLRLLSLQVWGRQIILTAFWAMPQALFVLLLYHPDITYVLSTWARWVIREGTEFYLRRMTRLGSSLMKFFNSFQQIITLVPLDFSLQDNCYSFWIHWKKVPEHLSSHSIQIVRPKTPSVY